MRLDLPSTGGEASIEFIIGDAVYRSDTGTHSQVQPRPGDKGVYRDSTGAKWRIEGPVGGRAVFRDVPLTSGDPFEGKERLDRLVIEVGLPGPAVQACQLLFAPEHPAHQAACPRALTRPCG